MPEGFDEQLDFTAKWQASHRDAVGYGHLNAVKVGHDLGIIDANLKNGDLFAQVALTQGDVISAGQFQLRGTRQSLSVDLTGDFALCLLIGQLAG